MDPVTIGLIAMAVGGGIKAISGLFDDTRQKEADITRREANLKLSALEDTQRRAEGQQTQVLSSTKARMAATGFDVDSSSFKNYLTGMAGEFQRQNTFAKQQGKASFDLMNQAADVQAGTGWQKGLQFTSDILGMAGSTLALG